MIKEVDGNNENNLSNKIDNSSTNNSKKNLKIISIIVLLVVIFSSFSYAYLYYKSWYNEKYIVAPTPYVTDVTLREDNTLSIKFSVPEENKNNKIYCLFTDDDKEPSKDDEVWTISNKNECTTTLLDTTTFAYLKNEDDEIYNVTKASTIGKIINFTINKEQIYVAINGNYQLETKLESIGNINKTISWYSDDETIATVDNNGKVTGIKKGNTIVHAKVMDNDISVKVMVTNLITIRPKKYNNKKPYLPCGKYNEEENNILDEILKDRINDVGYKTRAGAVEAARFLALEFPYKIRYFSENGRASTNGVDGEGRYYHLGLYLDESRFSKIGKKMHGPKTWGCQLYSRPSKGYRMNGFDCSGFISWAMLNGGFDVGDVGAGLAPHLDLTDYGKRIDFNANVVKSGSVKVGDLLSSGGKQGGHIAMIVGEDSSYYYVAESLWTSPNVAVVIMPYSKKTIFNRYFYVMLMDSYYKEDGKLTKLWY